LTYFSTGSKNNNTYPHSKGVGRKFSGGGGATKKKTEN